MILLFGGTGETETIADALDGGGYRVLVSTATEIPLAVGSRFGVLRRFGRMDQAAICELIDRWSIRAIVDAAHPFASALHQTAAAAAKESGIPYFRFDRESGGDFSFCIRVEGHEDAAKKAFSFGEPVLLTTGSNNLLPYADEARRTGVPLYARVLDDRRSLAACAVAGLLPEQIIAKRGPFSLAENCELLRGCGAGVLVTKDSGVAGGVAEKIEAAKRENCRVVLISRPEDNPEGHHSVDALLDALDRSQVGRPSLVLDLESVLVPEIWVEVAKKTRVSALALTTREEADYGELMRRRIGICRENGISLEVLRSVIEGMEPLAGAADFLAEAERSVDIVIATDSFQEFLFSLLPKLGGFPVFCNRLRVGEDGFFEGVEFSFGGKRGVVESLRKRGKTVWAAGDSFNDLPMLEAADRAFLFRPSAGLLCSGFPILQSYEELLASISGSVRK